MLTLASELTDWLSTVANILVAMCTAIAVCIARRGLRTWREQVDYEIDHALARRLLTETYRLRDAVRTARRPIMSAVEFRRAHSKLRDELGVTAIEGVDTSLLQVPALGMRWDEVLQVQRAVEREVCEAEAIWGKAWASEFRTVAYRPASMLQDAINEYSIFHDTPGGMEHDRADRLRRTIYLSGTPSNPDSIELAIEDSIPVVEQLVAPKLRPRLALDDLFD
ncbi:MAG: hypothetical protein J0L78_00080 [Planctomycetes bacterium]|nr:hypothetical protein [Planctomycetota bacterium]